MFTLPSLSTFKADVGAAGVAATGAASSGAIGNSCSGVYLLKNREFHLLPAGVVSSMIQVLYAHQ
jgi:hypothetical protein